MRYELNRSSIINRAFLITNSLKVSMNWSKLIIKLVAKGGEWRDK